MSGPRSNSDLITGLATSGPSSHPIQLLIPAQPPNPSGARLLKSLLVHTSQGNNFSPAEPCQRGRAHASDRLPVGMASGWMERRQKQDRSFLKTRASNLLKIMNPKCSSRMLADENQMSSARQVSKSSLARFAIASDNKKAAPSWKSPRRTENFWTARWDDEPMFRHGLAGGHGHSYSAHECPALHRDGTKSSRRLRDPPTSLVETLRIFCWSLSRRAVPQRRSNR